MVHPVRVRHIGNFDERKAELQQWLESNQIKPRFFEHSSGAPGVVFHVAFDEKGDAEAFAAAFSGHVLGDDPQGHALWGEPQQPPPRAPKLRQKASSRWPS